MICIFILIQIRNVQKLNIYNIKIYKIFIYLKKEHYLQIAMNSIYLSQQTKLPSNIQSSIQLLKAQLQKSKAQQKKYIIQITTLQSIRSKISHSIQQLSNNYKKQIKALQQKVHKLSNENKHLIQKNSLYQIEIQNFQKRLLQKDQIISNLLAKDFMVASKPHIIQYAKQNSSFQCTSKSNKNNSKQASKIKQKTTTSQIQSKIVATDKNMGQKNDVNEIEIDQFKGNGKLISNQLEMDQNDGNIQQQGGQNLEKRRNLEKQEANKMQQILKQDKIQDLEENYNQQVDDKTKREKEEKNKDKKQLQQVQKNENNKELGNGQNQSKQKQGLINKEQEIIKQSLSNQNIINQNLNVLNQNPYQSQNVQYQNQLLKTNSNIYPYQSYLSNFNPFGFTQRQSSSTFNQSENHNNQIYSQPKSVHYQNSQNNFFHVNQLKKQTQMQIKSFTNPFTCYQQNQVKYDYPQNQYDNLQNYQNHQLLSNYQQKNNQIKQFKQFKQQNNEIKQVKQSNNEIKQVIEVKKTIPPPPLPKKLIGGVKAPVKRNIKTKNLPKYRQYQQDQNNLQERKKEVTSNIQNENILGQFSQQGNKYHNDDKKINKQQNPRVQWKKQQFKTQINIINKSKQIIPNFDNQQTKLPKQQLPLIMSSKLDDNNNKSHSSTNKSRRSKRPHQKPTQLGVITFSQNTASVSPNFNHKQQTKHNLNSQQFFSKLSNDQNEPQFAKQQNQQLNSFTPKKKVSDDHQMHGFVDQSSIQQIEDTSMISNPIFLEQQFDGVQGNKLTYQRKGSIDQNKAIPIKSIPPPPAPGNRMSKKKPKRENISMIDPTSFL